MADPALPSDIAAMSFEDALSELEQIEFQVLKPNGFDDVILAGMVDRERALDSEQPLSLRMKLIMLGVRYKMADDHLVLLPVNPWVPMLKKGTSDSSRGAPKSQWQRLLGPLPGSQNVDH